MLHAHTRGSFEDARQVTRAHPRQICQIFQGRPLPRVGDQPILDAMDSRVEMRTVLDEHASLAAASVSSEIDHHLTRHPSRHEWAVILLNYGQSEVDAGSDTRAGENGSVLDKKAIGEHACGRESSGHSIGDLPMRGTAAIVENAGSSQQPRTAANGADPRSDIVRSPQPLDGKVRHLAEFRRVDTGDQYPILGVDGRQASEIGDGETLRCLDLRHSPAELQIVGGTEAVGFVKHLNRARQIHGMNMGQHQHMNLTASAGCGPREIGIVA